jgi:hypothetical protein
MFCGGDFQLPKLYNWLKQKIKVNFHVIWSMDCQMAETPTVATCTKGHEILKSIVSKYIMHISQVLWG